MKNMTRGILAALLAATASTGFAQSLATPTSGNNPSNDSTSIGTSISTGIAQPPARPSSCTDTPYSWTVGGNTCSGVIPSAYNGYSSQAANNTSGYSGFASFACYNGTWQGPDTSSDSCAPVQAAAPATTAATGAACAASTFTYYNGGAAAAAAYSQYYYNYDGIVYGNQSGSNTPADPRYDTNGNQPNCYPYNNQKVPSLANGQTYLTGGDVSGTAIQTYGFTSSQVEFQCENGAVQYQGVSSCITSVPQS